VAISVPLPWTPAPAWNASAANLPRGRGQEFDPGGGAFCGRVRCARLPSATKSSEAGPPFGSARMPMGLAYTRLQNSWLSSARDSRGGKILFPPWQLIRGRLCDSGAIMGTPIQPSSNRRARSVSCETHACLHRSAAPNLFFTVRIAVLHPVHRICCAALVRI
jgi:hypothetical protein